MSRIAGKTPLVRRGKSNRSGGSGLPHEIDICVKLC